MPILQEDERMTLMVGSCLDELKALPDNSIDAAIPDPPYGFDPLDEHGNERPLEDSDWDLADARRDLTTAGRGDTPEEKLRNRLANGVNYPKADERYTPEDWGVHPVLGGFAEEKGLIALPRYILPPKALFHYQLWTAMWSAEVLRVLKPGGHLLSFNAPECYHRMACGIEDAGFEIRDTLHWTYSTGFPFGVTPWHAMDKADGFTKKKRTEADERAKKHLDTRQVIHEPQGENAKAWAGWHTGLKPSHELIAVARKPFKGPVHKNLLEHGVGAYNVEACAVPGDGDSDSRWPSNTILTHAPECGEALHECAPWCPVRQLEEATPGASRHYLALRWSKLDSIIYQPKPSQRERHGAIDSGRNTHPTVKPVALIEYLLRLVARPGSRVLDNFAGSGTFGVAAIRAGYYPVMVERNPSHANLIVQRTGKVQLPLFIS